MGQSLVPPVAEAAAAGRMVRLAWDNEAGGGPGVAGAGCGQGWPSSRMSYTLAWKVPAGSGGRLVNQMST
jgi:hypothetical protein